MKLQKTQACNFFDSYLNGILARNRRVENKLQVKASHMFSTHGVKIIKKKWPVQNSYRSLGLRESLAHRELGSRFPELVDTIENFGKECYEILCILSIHANYVAVKMTGGGVC